MNVDDIKRDENGRVLWPGGGYYDDEGKLHFPDTDVLDAEWSKRHRRLFGQGG